MPFQRPFHFVRHVVFGLAAVILFALAFGWVVMLAWNAVLPPLFALPALTYGQGIAVLVLVRILTGRFTHGPHGHGRHARLAGGKHGAALYSAWWDAEGEAAFQDYIDRQLGQRT